MLFNISSQLENVKLSQFYKTQLEAKAECCLVFHVFNVLSCQKVEKKLVFLFYLLKDIQSYVAGW